jgi:polysaccharide export outer membrane protein
LVFVPTLAQVEVQGQVQIPGKILIRQRIRIDHALTRAGGPIYDEADLSKLVIGKPDGNQVIIEVSEQFWKDLNEEDESYYLQNGDVLYVPNAYKVDRIYVLGYVHQPGAHKIRAPITIQQAVALAGGATEKANRKEAIIRRLSSQIEQVTLGDDLDSKILIHPGDSVEIPKKFGVNWSLIFSFISVSSVAISILSRR